MNRHQHARVREALVSLSVHGRTVDEDWARIRGPRGGLTANTMLSPNAKTGVSLDFPIGETCEPTAVCAQVCYAARPGTPAMWNKSVAKRLRTYRLFRELTPATIVEQLEDEHARFRRRFAKRGIELDFLRVCGTGDLFPEAVEVVNLLARRNPQLQVWVVTRIVRMARPLVPRPNLHLQFSFDATSGDPTAALEVLELHGRNGYASYLRTSPEQRPGPAVRVIFDEKRTRGLPRDPRQCPADAGRLELGNIRGQGGDACSRCRRCFRG